MALQQAQKLKSQIQAEIQALEARIKTHRGVKSLIKTRCSINSLSSIKERLERIESILKIPKYDIVFIGKIGVGKTTAICHLFNLILSESKPIGNSKKTVTRFEEILATGSGRTTIGEVIIQPSNTQCSYLRIEPYDDNELKEFIVEVGHYFWHRLYPNQQESTPEVPPAELLRAIRNLTNLREIRVDGKLVDQAVELARHCSALDDFIKAILERADLASRTKTELKLKPKTKTLEEEKQWLKERFSQLNLGKVAGYSLPKKILVYVSPKILDFNQYPRLNTIIDTRGMDDLRDRKDLEDYIRGRDNTICILADQFAAAPTNVSGLMKKYLTQESRDIDTKLALLVLVRKGEAENVVGLDGKVQEKQEGIEVRKSQINDAFARDHIKSISSNILFYDALQFYDEECTLKPHYEAEDIEIERNRLLSAINHLIEEREAVLLREIQNYQAILEQIKAGEGLSKEEEKLILDLKKKIEQHRALNFRSNFQNQYVYCLKSYHVMVFRALNNRFGVYDLRGKDIYHDASDETEKLLRERLAKDKENIIGAIDLVEQHALATSGLKPVMQILRDQVDDHFEKMVLYLAKTMRGVVKNALAPQSFTNPFWVYAQIRWGKGSGYRDDVLSQYYVQLQDSNDFLTHKVQATWESEFMNQILAFFGEC